VLVNVIEVQFIWIRSDRRVISGILPVLRVNRLAGLFNQKPFRSIDSPMRVQTISSSQINMICLSIPACKNARPQGRCYSKF